MKKTKFKVELEIEIEYNISNESDVSITPYTNVETWLDNNIVNLKSKVGKIIDINPTKMIRLGK